MIMFYDRRIGFYVNFVEFFFIVVGGGQDGDCILLSCLAARWRRLPQWTRGASRTSGGLSRKLNAEKKPLYLCEMYTALFSFLFLYENVIFYDVRTGFM